MQHVELHAKHDRSQNAKELIKDKNKFPKHGADTVTIRLISSQSTSGVERASSLVQSA